MNQITHNYSGKSLLELREKYGTGDSGFYDNSWWLDEPFATEKPKKGKYEINFRPELNIMTFEEQKSKLGQDEEFLHPAILVEAILEHYKKTGERLMEDWYSRTSVVDSVGGRVGVGPSANGGVRVAYYWDDFRHDLLGLASARKLEPRNLDALEDRVLELEKFKERVERVLKI